MPDNPITCPSCGEENPIGTKTCGFCKLPLISWPRRTSNNGTRIINADFEPKSAVFTTSSLIANRYEVLRELGRGGMGEVYLVADHKMNGRQIALKFMSVSLIKDEDARRRFSQEVEAAQLLRHENIVTVYHLDESDGRVFFTMAYVPGKSLRELLLENKEAGKTFCLDNACAIMRPVLSALAHAHSQGIIHRDLKPENIAVEGVFPDIAVKVLDFGLARIMSPSRLTSTAVAMGTAYYMSPEQLSGEREIDQRSDVFSAGAVLYELLTGRIPTGLFKLPSQLVEGLPEALDQVIANALQTDREDRYADISRMGHELQRILDASKNRGQKETEVRGGQAAAVKKVLKQPQKEQQQDEGPAGSRPPPSRRSKLILLAGCAVSLLLMMAGIFYWQSLPEPSWETVAGCPAPALQDAHWADIRNAEQPAVFKEYLNRCPDGRYAALAKQNLEDLNSREAERKRIAEVQQREVELERQRSIEAEQRQAEQERQRQIEAEERQAELERQRQIEAEQRQAELERQRQATEARRQREEEARRARAVKTAELLDSGLAAVAADRLLLPQGSNAVGYFQEVLEIDPGNAAARDGLHKVVDRYIAIAESALSRGDPAEARKNLDSARSIGIDHSGLIRLEARITAFKLAAEARRQREDEIRRAEQRNEILSMTRTLEGVAMPEALIVNDNIVALNGAGVRRVMFMKPYVAGLYLRAPETNPTKIMMADELQVIRLTLLSSQGRSMFLRALRNGLRSAANSLGMTWASLEPGYYKFSNFLHDDFEQGDVFEFRYLPGTGFQVFKNNELKGTLVEFDFKKAFLGIWLNNDAPADTDLKKALLQGNMRISIAGM